ncbi:low molecular weight phosphotyrosine protein phosphatase [Ferrovibrio terrae]|uniref:protein-tyrosine-phosphatase n=1 Tax=Ferrovibrio terrae TaxID=2594003 RepID=A0A516GWD5_9PROT|nr:low molecular weight protein-tyrosine-phosphatase [Ferrovibrio terrae]QDO95838.1 low molecular weight phosphotyrosine protein phosphatase [Ferrovibrio terrae]
MAKPAAKKPDYAVLMVCTGNICRSPTADGLLRHALQAAGLSDRVLVDSAGTHDYHIGDPPDRRSVATAQRYGVDLAELRARQVTEADFASFDLVLAMDDGHYRQLLRLCPPQYRDRVKLYLSYAPQFGRDVPDPYYGKGDGFEKVWQMCQAVTDALVTDIRSRLR